MTGALWQLLAVLACSGAVLTWPRRRRPAGSTPGCSARGRERVPAPPEVPIAVVVELVAAALSAGLPPADALEATARAVGTGTASGHLRRVVGALRLGAATDAAWAPAGVDYQPLARALVLAERTGASTATALRRTASDERAARRRRAQVAARRLAVQLVLPLGLATLPAFALLAVVPVLIGLALQVVG